MQQGRVQRNNSRPPQLIALVVLLGIECAIVIAAAGYLLVELLVDTPQSYASAIAVLMLTALAAAWLVVIAVNALRGQPWIRGAAIVWQVLQLSIGVGSLQGEFALPWVGWPLVTLAALVFALLFTKPVIAATARRED